MKSVMISIQPKWCELIASGKKTVEVRKTRPKIDTPFRCYIYCTNTKTIGDFILCKSEENAKLFGFNTAKGINKGFAEKEDIQLKGKVIGEFVCDKIDEYTNYSLDEQNGHINRRENLLRSACMTLKDWRDYIGSYISDFGYAWYISDLVIYGKPKELREFNHCGVNYHFNPPITRPPQSWCYVEEKQ